MAFFLLRIFRLYGNGQPGLQPWFPFAAGPWAVQPALTLTIVSFFDTLKYPPSLQFLLMTLGPSIMALAWLEKINSERGFARILVIFGRVPLFYYVVHLFVIHTLAVWVGLICGKRVAWLLYGGPLLRFPSAGYGYSLPFIYAMWFASLALLYPACKWFSRVKQEHPGWQWLRYL